MTNREYEKKQHRGSAPSLNTAMKRCAVTGTGSAEEWRNALWYPQSSVPTAAGTALREGDH